MKKKRNPSSKLDSQRRRWPVHQMA